MAVTFEGYERRIDQIMPVLNKYGIKDLAEISETTNDLHQVKEMLENEYKAEVLTFLSGVAQ